MKDIVAFEAKQYTHAVLYLKLFTVFPAESVVLLAVVIGVACHRHLHSTCFVEMILRHVKVFGPFSPTEGATPIRPKVPRQRL